MNSTPGQDRALITGIAAIAPNGSDTKSFWQATCEGVSGIGPISRFDAAGYPVHLAGEVTDLDLAGLVEERLTAQTDRWSQLGLAAATRALDDAALVPEETPGYSMAVITASSSGGNEFGQREISNLWSKGPRHVGPYQSIAWFYAATTGQISISKGMKGPCGVVVAEQAGGIDTFAHARRALRMGDARTVLTGGVEAPIGPYALACQLSSGLLSRDRDPARAYRPFHKDADGYVPGEGGAMLIMESESSARGRGADRPYGEIAGYASTFDPRPSTGLEPGLHRAITLALDDARVHPADIDVVYADGHGLPLHDQQEADAITRVFGARKVPVTAPKCLYGRLYAGGPPLDVAAALLSIRDGVVPGTATTDQPAYTLDLVTAPRTMPVRTCLVLARGYGGFNAALVVRGV
jgi:act minimal PKS chain-length factor (CLF/KS beta)